MIDDAKIKVITEPSIFLIGTQQVDPGELSRFLAHVGAPDWESDALSPGEALVEIAGRNCYASFKHPRPGGNAAYLEHILDVGHGSVLEHIVFNFIVTGISRSLTHEWVRHRAGWGYSQLSQRFYDESDASFVVPPALIGLEDTDAYDLWIDACYSDRRRYRGLVAYLEDRPEFAALDKTMRHKRVCEAARSVLPNCVETRMFATANGRALRHFLNMRGSVPPDLEIRRLTVALARRLKVEAPNLFADISISTADDGREVVTVDHPHV